MILIIKTLLNYYTFPIVLLWKIPILIKKAISWFSAKSSCNLIKYFLTKKGVSLYIVICDILFDCWGVLYASINHFTVSIDAMRERDSKWRWCIPYYCREETWVNLWVFRCFADNVWFNLMVNQPPSLPPLRFTRPWL